MLARMMSGGQTGVDRAALDVARARGVPSGGWCPNGRKAEDGVIEARYPLTETPSADYEQRTAWNVRDADGTLVLSRGTPSGGTAQTIAFAKTYRKPYLVVDLSDCPDSSMIRAWIRTQGVKTLNVAGPRESKAPGIYAQAAALLQTVLSEE